MGNDPRHRNRHGRTRHAALACADGPRPDPGEDAQHRLRVSDDVRHVVQRGPAQAETRLARRTGNGRPSCADDVPPVAARSPGEKAGEIARSREGGRGYLAELGLPLGSIGVVPRMPKISSSSQAPARSWASPRGAATIWSPTGRPDAVKPHGKDNAGQHTSVIA